MLELGGALGLLSPQSRELFEDVANFWQFEVAA